MKSKKLLLSHQIVIFIMINIIVLLDPLFCDETKWLAIGSFHNWYSSAGGEIEIGLSLGLTTF